MQNLELMDYYLIHLFSLVVICEWQKVISTPKCLKVINLNFCRIYLIENLSMNFKKILNWAVITNGIYFYLQFSEFRTNFTTAVSGKIYPRSCFPKGKKWIKDGFKSLQIMYPKLSKGHQNQLQSRRMWGLCDHSQSSGFGVWTFENNQRQFSNYLTVKQYLYNELIRCFYKSWIYIFLKSLILLLI